MLKITRDLPKKGNLFSPTTPSATDPPTPQFLKTHWQTPACVISKLLKCLPFFEKISGVCGTPQHPHGDASGVNDWIPRSAR